jgi:hypothetical protein
MTDLSGTTWRGCEEGAEGDPEDEKGTDSMDLEAMKEEKGKGGCFGRKRMNSERNWSRGGCVSSLIAGCPGNSQGLEYSTKVGDAGKFIIIRFDCFGSFWIGGILN